MAPARKQSRWQDSAQESVAQAFLEAAGPIILENRQLTPESRAQLQEVARKFGLTDSQLDLELQLLHDRGVIQVPAAPRAKKPTPSGAPAKSAAPPTPQPTRAPQPVTGSPREVLEIMDEEPAAPPFPPVPPVIPGAGPARGIEPFLEQAVLLIAQHRGLTPPCRVLLDKAAQACGVSAIEAQRAIESLQGVGTRGGASPSASVASSTAAAPPPPMAAPTGGPAEEFRIYLRQVFAQLSSGFLSEAAEQKLARTGRKQHSLSSVYVRHLLSEVAAQERIRLPGQLASPGTDPDASEANAAKPSENSKIQQFLQKAAPIIAEHRGVNARSRIFLSAVARDQGLSDEELELALDQLLGRSTAPADRALAEQLAERNESYRAHLREALPTVEHGIIVPKKRRKLLDAGEFQEGLPREMADASLREIAAELGVRLISQERAAEHVERLLDELMGNRIRVSGENRDRILAEAAQWGLTIEHTNALIIDRVRANQRRRVWESQRTKLLLGLAFLVLLGAVIWMGVIVARTERPVGAGPESTPETTVAGKSGPDEAEKKPKNWWDTNLQIAIMNARLTDSAWVPELEKIQAAEDTERAATYDRVMMLAEASLDKPQALKLLGDILAGSSALEPSDQNAEHIIELLLAAIPAASEDVPQTDAPFRLGFWATRVISSALTYRGGTPERSQSLAIAVSNHLGHAIDASGKKPDVEHECLVAAAKQMYAALTAAASFQPLRVGALRGVVAAEAEKVVDATELDRLEANFLAALIPRVGEGWREYKDQILHAIDSPDSTTVMTMLEMYERSPNRDVQNYMTPLLLARANAGLTDRSVEKVGQSVRAALGVRVAATQEGRWAAIRTKAEAVLSTSTATTAQSELLFQEIISLAHYSTAACALMQKELGAASFEQLAQDGPPRLIEESEEGAAFGSPANVGRASLRPMLERLGAPNPAKRIPALRNLESALSGISDLAPDEATLLAKYLLRPRGGAESQMVNELLEPMSRFAHLRIALADALLDVRERAEHVEVLLSRLTNRKVDAPNLDEWKAAVRQDLLKSAINLLGPGAELSGSVADRAAGMLHSRYVEQAKLLALPADAYSKTHLPSEVQRLLIQNQTGILSGQVNDPNDQSFVADVSHEMTAAEYLGSSDLQLTASLQRIWLRLLAIEVSRRQPELRSKSQAIVQKLQERDRTVQHVVEQIRDGEIAILQTWLLFAEIKR